MTDEAELRKTLRAAISRFEGTILTPKLRAQVLEAMRVELAKHVPDWRKPLVVATPWPGDDERGIMRFEVREPEN